MEAPPDKKAAGFCVNFYHISLCAGIRHTIVATGRRKAAERGKN
jgi:hypothetical protein